MLDMGLQQVWELGSKSDMVELDLCIIDISEQIICLKEIKGSPVCSINQSLSDMSHLIYLAHTVISQLLAWVAFSLKVTILLVKLMKSSTVQEIYCFKALFI